MEQPGPNRAKLYSLLFFAISLPLVVSFFVFPSQWSIFFYALAFSAGAVVLTIPVKRIIGIHHWAAMLRLERHRAQYESYHHKENVLHLPSGQVKVAAVLNASQQIQQIEGQAQLIEPVPHMLDIIKTWEPPLVVHGGQQEGKTRLAITLAHSLDLPSIMLGFRLESQYHWPGLVTFCEEDAAGQVAAGVESCLTWLKDYEPGVVILDDMTNLPGLADMEDLVLMLGTQALAHNKRVFFTMHSLDKAAFGLGKVGAGIKNNFSLLKMDKASRDLNQNIISYPSQGKLYHPAAWQEDGQPVILPSSLGFQQPDEDSQFVRDWFTLSQNEGIKKYYGSKNGQTRQKYLERAERLGLK